MLNNASETGGTEQNQSSPPECLNRKLYHDFRSERVSSERTSFFSICFDISFRLWREARGWTPGRYNRRRGRRQQVCPFAAGLSRPVLQLPRPSWRFCTHLPQVDPQSNTIQLDGTQRTCRREFPNFISKKYFRRSKSTTLVA